MTYPASIGVFAVVLAVFSLDATPRPSDSRWSLQTAISIARGRGGDLTGYVPEGTAHYALRERNGRPRTRHPIGTSLLVVPGVVMMARLHPHFENDLRAGHTPRIEMLFAGIIAAVPENVDRNPARLWDWSDPQFAR